MSVLRRLGDVPVRIHRAAKDDAPAVLFFHGLGVSGEVNAKEADSLARAGLTTVLVDAPHHGVRRDGLLDEMQDGPADVAHRLCLRIVREARDEVPALVDRLLADGHVHIGICGISLGVGSRRDVLDGSGPGWALTGDAGHFKDPVLGQGIRDALRFGRLAGEVAAAALDVPRRLDVALSTWEAKRDRECLPAYQWGNRETRTRLDIYRNVQGMRGRGGEGAFPNWRLPPDPSGRQRGDAAAAAASSSAASRSAIASGSGARSHPGGSDRGHSSLSSSTPQPGQMKER